MRNNRFLTFAFGAFASYVLYRFWYSQLTHLSPSVQKKLPITKPLNTIHDSEGNYDIDGVSFDVEGVIVSGDDNKHLNPMG